MLKKVPLAASLSRLRVCTRESPIKPSMVFKTSTAMNSTFGLTMGFGVSRAKKLDG